VTSAAADQRQIQFGLKWLFDRRYGRLAHCGDVIEGVCFSYGFENTVDSGAYRIALAAASTLDFYFLDVEEGNATLIVSPSANHC